MQKLHMNKHQNTFVEQVVLDPHEVSLLRHAERAEKKEMIEALHAWMVTEMLELTLSSPQQLFACAIPLAS